MPRLEDWIFQIEVRMSDVADRISKVQVGMFDPEVRIGDPRDWIRDPADGMSNPQVGIREPQDGTFNLEDRTSDPEFSASPSGCGIPNASYGIHIIASRLSQFFHWPSRPNRAGTGKQPI
jgi:hypothetical protein